MPSTIAAIVILVIAAVPGALGSYLYRAINGLDWREREWNTAVRYVAFSASGLIVYILAAGALGLPPAAHVIPSSFDPAHLSAAGLPALLLPYTGHLLGSALSGVAAAFAVRGIANLTHGIPQPCAWDAFVNKELNDRWVVLTLKSGDAYAGYIAVADSGVPASDRDIVLREPARYEPNTQSYQPTGMRDLFIRADLLDSIASLAVPGDTALFAPPTLSLENGHERQVQASSTTPSPRPE